MGRHATKPSDLELQILGLLWREGPMTARKVLEAMPDGKQRAYTSVLSVLQVMEKKGLIEHDRPETGLAYIFRPAVGRREVLGPLMRRMVQGVFGGDPATAVQQLLSETAVDQDQIQEIRKLLDKLDNKKGRNPSSGDKR